ncbi:hypothetical protein NBH13_04775, partial [Bifidobacterium sp. M3-R-103]|uniref:hypothetical protein n=1 Tax=Bifidobacterium sp. M3-R-103 TaxID=2949652 RepID=UPI00202DCEFC
PAPRGGTRRRNVSFDPHAYERTAPPIIESEFLQSNNRGAVQFTMVGASVFSDSRMQPFLRLILR